MIKKFNIAFKTFGSTDYTNRTFEIDTSLIKRHWFQELWHYCSGQLAKWDYNHDAYITEYVVWDGDINAYDNATDLNTFPRHYRDFGYYLKYIRDARKPRGIWMAQYPDNARMCMGIHTKESADVVAHNLIRDPHYHLTRANDLGHILSTVLFPDRAYHVDENIDAMIVPTKQEALRAVEDAMRAFEIIKETRLIESYNQVPDAYFVATQRIIQRLSNVKQWIEVSTTKNGNIFN